MAEQKVLKVSFAVDNNSFNQVKRALEQLTQQAAAFSKAMNGGGSPSGMGGMGGGLVSGGSLGGGGTMQQAVAKSSPLQANQFNAFKNLANVSKDALKSMTDALRKSTTDQERELNKQIALLDKLSKSYQNIGGFRSQDTLNAIASKMGKVSEKAAELTANVQAGQKALAGAGGGGGGVPPSVMAAAAAPGGGGFMARMGYSGVGMGQLPFGAAMGAAGGMMGKVMRFVGGGLGATAGLGLTMIHREMMENPMRYANYQAQMGQLLQGQQLQSMRGDYGYLRAQGQVLRDPGLRGDYNDLNSGYRRLAKNIGGLFTTDVNQIGRVFSGEYADVAIERERQGLIASTRDRSPILREIEQEYQGGWRGRLSALRAGGWGLRRGESSYSAMQRIQASSPGFDVGEILAARQGITVAGTRAAANAMQGNVLQAQGAGIMGAAQIGGIMSNFGIGTGNQFVKSLRYAVGGGMDVSTASLLGNFVANQAQQVGMQNQTGMGMLGMLGFGATGPGGQGQLIAQQNIRGAAALQNVISGGIDPYQQARNLQMAIGAAPTSGIYAQDYLATKMSLPQMADIMAGGKVSPIAQAMGIGRGQVSDMFKGVTSSLFERMLVEPQMAGTPMGKVISSMMESGQDPSTWFKKGGAGKLGMKREEAVSGYASALLMSGVAPDEAAAMGLARDIFGMGRKGPTAGKMAGDIAGGATEMSMATAEIAIMKEKVEVANKALAEFEQGLRSAALEVRHHADLNDPTKADMVRKAIHSATQFTMDPKVANMTDEQRYNYFMEQQIRNQQNANAPKKGTPRPGSGSDLVGMPK